MIYNDDGQSEVPDLNVFKLNMVEYMLRRAFFQNEPLKEINMLKLPIIMAPCLVNCQVNRDTEKKSLLGKKISYDKSVFAKFCSMIEKKTINILNIHKMSYDQLKRVLENLGVPIGDRNATQMRTELDNMAKLFTAGQVNYRIFVPTHD